MREIIPHLVSTIIPVYNRPALLNEAVASVLRQTYRPIEVVIVDDGSTDETSQVGMELSKTYPCEVSYIRQDNGGVSVARNTGLRAATGEFVQFLDSDDLLMPEKFRLQVAGLRADPRCGISYCYVREYDPDKGPAGYPARRTADSFDFLFPQILFGRLWPAPTPLFVRSVIEVVGLFRPLSVYEDWEYEGRAAAIGVRLHHCREFLADKRNVHAREGRRKGGVPEPKLKDYALVHELILQYAKQAGVGKAQLQRFSVKLFLVARKCAQAGLEQEAKRCLALAMETCARRGYLALYKAASDAYGWRRVGMWYEGASNSVVALAGRGAVRLPRAFYALWKHRVIRARETLRGQPLNSWPTLLTNRWINRRSRSSTQP